MFGVQTVLPAILQIPNTCSNTSSTSNTSSSIGYHRVFSSPWAPHIEIEEKHFQISRVITRWARQSSTQIVDQFQLVLLTIILFLSCDDTTSLDHNQKAKIEQIQLKYILMFQRYLKVVHPKEANRKFVGGLMLLHHSKELEQLHRLRLPF